MNKKYLLDEMYIEEFRQKIAEHNKTFIFLDYDGTLAPFHPVPEEAHALEESVSYIKKLAESDKYIISFISGRKLSGLQKMIEVENVSYAGSHGLEIKLAFEDEVIYPFQDSSISQESKNKYKKIQKSYSKREDLRVEDKGFGLAFHCESREVQKEIEEELNTEFKYTSYQILAGREIVEIRPQGWHKGKALKYIAENLAEYHNIDDYLNIYIGDDSTDEDAFRELKDGVSIYVQNEGDLNTSADYYIKNPQDTAELLKKLAGEL